MKFGREKLNHFRAIHVWISCFLNFLPDLAKNVISNAIWEYRPYNLGLQGPPKSDQKNDASLSVDGFGGVRNGDRIRAAGDVLSFHIVKLF